jgi:hypothetical protein
MWLLYKMGGNMKMLVFVIGLPDIQLMLTKNFSSSSLLEIGLLIK